MTLAKIITCPEWQARPATGEIVWVGKSSRIIFHHTAGHHRELDEDRTVESYAEAVGYARDIQAYHMNGNGWIDSGHNFLVCRNGLILQGRWRTVSAIQQGKMVRSAHCPGQNDQIGIEHEHRLSEEMTAAQKLASAQLQAWIAVKYGRKTPLPVYPHSRFYNTSCPANLAEDMQAIRDKAKALMSV